MRRNALQIGWQTFSQTGPCYYEPAVQNSVGKRENVRKRANAPFPTVFSNNLENFPSFSSNLELSSANSLFPGPGDCKLVIKS